MSSPPEIAILGQSRNILCEIPSLRNRRPFRKPYRCAIFRRFLAGHRREVACRRRRKDPAMSIRNLDKIFDPHRVAVIGASDTPTSVGYTVLRNLVGSGFRGRRLSGQPEARSGPRDPGLQGHSQPAARAGPGRDLHARAHRVPALVRAVAARRARGASSSSRPAFAKSVTRAASWKNRSATSSASSTACGFSVPNCLGIIVPGINLNASFAAATPDQGTHRLHFAVRRLVYVGARLGHRRGHRLLLFRFGRQHARREHGRPDRLLRLGHGDAIDHSLHRVDQRGARVHVGGPGVRPHEADRGLQGGPIRRVGARPPPRTPAPWPAWTPCTRRPFSGQASNASSKSKTCSTAPSCWPVSSRPRATGWRSSPMPAGRA